MKKLKGVVLAATCVMLTVSIGHSVSAQNAENGEDLFATQCGDCHSVSKAIRNKRGPSLFGVIGRKAATVEGFKYSEQMAASGTVWTPDKVNAYITNPKALLPEGTMKFDGLSKEADRADIIAFLMGMK